MDLEIITLNEVSQRQISYNLYVESEKWYKWIIYKMEIKSQT